jgi:hypothetical protein
MAARTTAAGFYEAEAERWKGIALTIQRNTEDRCRAERSNDRIQAYTDAFWDMARVVDGLLARADRWKRVAKKYRAEARVSGRQRKGGRP